jgi:hypothetical protein
MADYLDRVSALRSRCLTGMASRERRLANREQTGQKLTNAAPTASASFRLNWWAVLESNQRPMD